MSVCLGVCVCNCVNMRMCACVPYKCLYISYKEAIFINLTLLLFIYFRILTQFVSILKKS